MSIEKRLDRKKLFFNLQALCFAPGSFFSFAARMRSRRGLGMIEVILFLSIFVLMVGLLSPMVIQQIVNSRVESTREEMQQTYSAIVGELKAGTYGFVGDMGRLPTQLQELRSPLPGTPLYNLSNTNGIGMGWNGPYVNFGKNPDDYLTDAFGTPYDFGIAGIGQIRSAGPDLTMGTADDILVPPQPLHFTGQLAVTVRTFDGQAYFTDPPDCTVSVYYSESGVQRVATDSTSPFVFENIPRGLHAVSAACGAQRTSNAPGATLTVALQGFGQTNSCEITLPGVHFPIGAAQSAGTAGAGDPLVEAQDLLNRQRAMIQQRADISPLLKNQYETARSRVVSSIELALKQRANQDPAASGRNLQRALSELDVLYGFVRKSPLGTSQSGEHQQILEMEGQLRERLSKAAGTAKTP